jgi:hypothetical protein
MTFSALWNCKDEHISEEGVNWFNKDVMNIDVGVEEQ